MHYSIKINSTPEIFGNEPYYFWCVLKNDGEFHYNCGHGWAKSIEVAACDAINYYKMNINLS